MNASFHNTILKDHWPIVCGRLNVQGPSIMRFCLWEKVAVSKILSLAHVNFNNITFTGRKSFPKTWVTQYMLYCHTSF